MLIRGLALVAVSMLSGCLFIPSDPNPPCTGGRCTPPPECNFPTGLLTSRILPGVGAPDPGYDGVIITANTGGSYRITWDTTWMGFNTITGTVTNEGCVTPQFMPGCSDRACTLTARDRVIVGTAQGQIAFEGYPGSNVRSGFDIIIGDANRLMIDVQVNGQRDPARVVFVSTDTQALASAPAIPFLLTTR